MSVGAEAKFHDNDAPKPNPKVLVPGAGRGVFVQVIEIGCPVTVR
jgi:hypothetical protein